MHGAIEQFSVKRFSSVSVHHTDTLTRNLRTAQYVGSLVRIVAALGIFKRNFECIHTTWEALEQETPS